MTDLLHIHKTFEKITFLDGKVHNREFDGCIFKNCDLANTDFTGSTFSDCEFTDCNLSMISLRGASLKSVTFSQCKLLGILFHECLDFLFAVEFSECVLDYASFTNKKMPKTQFINCSLKDTNFSGSTLTKSSFENCNLDGAQFHDTVLNEVNFATAQNYKIDPEKNSIRKARFSMDGLSGLLDKYDIRIV